MKLQITLEESTELREYAMNVIKSQMKRLVRDELKILAPMLVEQIAKTCLSDVREAVKRKLQDSVNNIFDRNVIAEEIHNLVVKKFDVEFAEGAQKMVATLFGKQGVK